MMDPTLPGKHLRQAVRPAGLAPIMMRLLETPTDRSIGALGLVLLWLSASLAPAQDTAVLAGKAASAEIKQVAGRVEGQAPPSPWWSTVRVGQALKERDGVRTSQRSSVVLGFDDATQVRVTEQSIVFLRGTGIVASPPSRVIEVVEGQADVVRPASQPHQPAIEVRVGSARALPRASAAAPGLARARSATDGGAQFMVYGGSSEVESAGKRVIVGEGMGTLVPAGRAPGTPERLLAAAKTGQPPGGSICDHANPKFTWSPVDGATGYVVEVCRDPACSHLIDRSTRVAENQWRPEGLPVAELYWRVTAVGGSGLDGFPSAPVRFSVRALWRRPLEEDPTP